MYSFENIKGLIQGFFSEDYWIYYLVYCLVFPFFIILFYVSIPFFMAIDFLKLLIIAVAFNIGLLGFICFFELIIEAIKRKNSRLAFNKKIEILEKDLSEQLGFELTPENIREYEKQQELKIKSAVDEKNSETQSKETSEKESGNELNANAIAQKSAELLAEVGNSIKKKRAYYIDILESAFYIEISLCSGIFVGILASILKGWNYSSAERIIHILIPTLTLYTVYFIARLVYYINKK